MRFESGVCSGLRNVSVQVWTATVGHIPRLFDDPVEVCVRQVGPPDTPRFVIDADTY